MSEKRNTKILAARIDPWTRFKVYKFAKTYKNRINLVITAAVNSLINKQNVPEKIFDNWLKEYNQKRRNSL